MKKNFKRTLAKVMAVALTVSLAGTAADADAAKKIALSKKSITVAKGSAKKVTIKNVKAKKVKKLTVKSTKKKVATVKKSGKTAFKVTGKKVGSAKINVTVKVKGKKKATKLTLKVKVTKKSTVTPAAPASEAPAASATAAPASEAPAASATAAPATEAPKADDPVASNDPAASQAPVEEVKPVQPDKPTTPANVLPVMNLREEMATEWSTAGGYGSVIFNTDDTVDFSSQPWKVTDGVLTAGSVYNNGVAWYLAADKSKVDLSAYGTVEITIKTDAEVKLMTWGGATDPASFWDKNDTWGNCTTVENGDGSKTLIYNVADVFAKPAKATALGLTLKSDTDGDDGAFTAKTGTIYSIVFKAATVAPTEAPDVDTATTETPDADTATTETPNADTATTETGSNEGGSDNGDTPVAPTENVVTLDLMSAVKADWSDVAVTEADDACKIAFSKTNQRVFFELPSTLDMSKVKEIRVKGNVPAQLTVSYFDSDFDKTADSWWTLAKHDNYPFWGADGTAVKTETLDYSEVGLTGNGGYISIGSNGVPDVEDSWDEVSYLIYSVEFVLND